MKTIWLSYAWDDNEAQDVDFVAQELESIGLTVKLDRWNIQAGKRLWEQIENFITDTDECDAWLLYATTNSLGSEPCREEFAYALDRALRTRNSNFPVIGLFPSSIDYELIPAAIRTRLFVSLNDSDWKERIKSAAEGKPLVLKKNIVLPYALDFHTLEVENESFKVIEVRTRAGSWTPSFIGIPMAEKDRVQPKYKFGPKGVFNQGTIMTMCGECESTDGKWWLMYASNEVTPSTSIYLLCQEFPTELAFGVHNGSPQFLHKLNKNATLN